MIFTNKERTAIIERHLEKGYSIRDTITVVEELAESKAKAIFQQTVKQYSETIINGEVGKIEFSEIVKKVNEQ